MSHGRWSRSSVRWLKGKQKETSKFTRQLLSSECAFSKSLYRLPRVYDCEGVRMIPAAVPSFFIVVIDHSGKDLALGGLPNSGLPAR